MGTNQLSTPVLEDSNIKYTGDVKACAQAVSERTPSYCFSLLRDGAVQRAMGLGSPVVT